MLYPSAFHKNGNRIEQDVVINDFNIAIIFKIFNLRFDKISTNACFSENSNGLDSDFENFGTQLNIKSAHRTPKQAITGILDNPKNCAIEDETKGPVEKPKVPIAIKIPIFLTESVSENFTTNPKDCG